MDSVSRPLARARDDTRDRLLAAAAACFAARGFSGTSVRDITARAGCNVGALTYHFGGKHNAYVAVLDERLAELTARRVGALSAVIGDDRPHLADVVRAFAAAFLEPLHGSVRGRETVMLLLREMVDGHLPPGLMAERMMRPTLDALAVAIDRACPGLHPARLTLCCHSLVSQLVHLVQVQRLHEHGRAGSLSPLDVEAAVDHIVRFTCAGVHCSVEASDP